MTKRLGLLGTVVLAVFIFGSFYFQLADGPSRTQTARLDPFGEINVHLETKPDPPKPGSIPLILHITDPKGKPVALDRVEYEYAYKDQAIRTLDGKIDLDGTVQAIASITDVGEWQIRVTLFEGNQQTQVQFLLRVNANI